MKKAAHAVYSFWEQQAKAHRDSQFATNPDPHFRTLEMRSIEPHLQDGVSVLDVGCGNGFSTFHFARKFPRSRFVGIDYSESMIRFASSALKKEKSSVRERCKFFVADVRTLSKEITLRGKKFDYIISERCLINLSTWKEQRTAIDEMRKLLKPQGRLVLAENTSEGLKRLNALRKTMRLPPITMRWHNRYLPEKQLFAYLASRFRVEHVENFANLYYIISRVVYAKLAALEHKEPRYDHPINAIACQLPSLGDYHYSPNFIFVLRKH